ncbi:hypothetical protein [Massilia soli]|uniref:Alpha/beta hydrolase n=1 Tax=Massilia soli TaxID=2792854 RepID=A0ABS7SPW1_9BURK|nr:hypothetical protein [Massilia soli]MBZ2207976.1 hypothetical protein [Massilia soli]
MKRHLVFVHGRAQHGKDAAALKQEWIIALKAGLAKSGLTLPVADDEIRFPYYGDTLDQIVKGSSLDDAVDIVVRGVAPSSPEEEFFTEYLAELKAAIGMPDDPGRQRGPLNWGWVQAFLSVLDKTVPFASAAGVALFTNDVFQYLYRKDLRNVMDDGVRAAFVPGSEAVVVSHSLGTVIAYNVLQSAQLRVPLFVTLGSPLAIRAVKRKLQPVSHPAAAARWFNAMDERDVVALYPLTSEHFAVFPPIENMTSVENFTENRHGIAGYLSDKEVARRIHDALIAP